MGNSKGKALVKKADATVGAVTDYGDYGDQGFENVSGEDLVLPFLGVLQSNSPQVAKEIGDGGLLDAKMGSLHNTVTNEVFNGKKGVLFVPACTEHCFVEWVQRGQGGGFVGVHAIDADLVLQAKKLSAANNMKFGKLFMAFDDEGKPTGNQMVETFYVYGVVMGEGSDEPTPVAIAFTSTKISPYKRWMTGVNMFTQKLPNGKKQRPPLFAHQLRITTKSTSNTEGEYANVVLTPEVGGKMKDSLLGKDSEVFQAAVTVRDMIRDGLARVSYETQESGTGEAADLPPSSIKTDGRPAF